MKAGLSLAIGIGSFALGVLVMIHGWGIEPQHWGWIIGGGMASVFLTGCAVAIGDM